MTTPSLTVSFGSDPTGQPSASTITADRAWTIGRSPDSDILVDDSRVSRRHLVVEYTGASWLIRDVSANGSWAAGERIDPAGLVVADSGQISLRLGDPAGAEIVVASTPAGPPPAAATVLAAAAPPVRPPVAYAPPPPPPPAIAPAPVGYAAAPAPVAPAPPPAYSPAPAPVAYAPPPAAPAPVAYAPPASAANPATPTPATPTPTGGRRPRRRRRWLIITLVVLLLLLVVGDRVAASAASTAAVQQVVQQSQGLGGKPSVSFGGIPFLTQVAFGKYSDIAVRIDGITPPEGPRIERISAHLKGAHIPLSKAMNDELKTIPVDRVEATVTVKFTELNTYLKNQPGELVVSAGKGGAVQVTGRATDDGDIVDVSGSGQIQVRDGQLTVVPDGIKVAGMSGLDDILKEVGGLSDLFPPIPVALPGLPFNVRLVSVRADRDSVIMSATADDVVLDAG